MSRSLILQLPLMLLAILVFTTPAHAQHMNQKDSPCAGVVITSDLVSCLWNAKNSSDAKLNSLYKHVRERLDAGELKSLTRTEQLWIQYRDANCSAERDLYGNGTAQGPAYLACLEAMTRARTTELEITYAVRLK